jgi:hypothetical protein
VVLRAIRPDSVVNPEPDHPGMRSKILFSLRSRQLPRMEASRIRRRRTSPVQDEVEDEEVEHLVPEPLTLEFLNSVLQTRRHLLLQVLFMFNLSLCMFSLIPVLHILLFLRIV